MKRRAMFLLSLAFAVSVAGADRPVVRRDTQFPVVLHTTVSTETVKVGDQITFFTTEGVLIGRSVVVPNGAEVIGSIDEVRQKGPDNLGATLVIRFRSVRWPGGEADLNAVVFSVEVTTQSEKAFFRHIHNLFSRPTLLENINVYAHIERNAFTEFTSSQSQIVLRPGIRLVLRQIDPDKEPETMVRNAVLDVNRSWKN